MGTKEDAPPMPPQILPFPTIVWGKLFVIPAAFEMMISWESLRGPTFPPVSGPIVSQNRSCDIFCDIFSTRIIVHPPAIRGAEWAWLLDVDDAPPATQHPPRRR